MASATYSRPRPRPISFTLDDEPLPLPQDVPKFASFVIDRRLDESVTTKVDGLSLVMASFVTLFVFWWLSRQ